jgi:hypothetical protein
MSGADSRLIIEMTLVESRCAVAAWDAFSGIGRLRLPWRGHPGMGFPLQTGAFCASPEHCWMARPGVQLAREGC